MVYRSIQRKKNEWSVLADLIAIALLICAFASTARRHYSPTASMWLIAWLMIALHFIAALFSDLPGVWGALAQILNLVALTWAGVLFQTAVIPHRKERCSREMMLLLLTVNMLYLTLLFTSQPKWTCTMAAALYGLGPLAITIFARRDAIPGIAGPRSPSTSFFRSFCWSSRPVREMAPIWR